MAKLVECIPNFSEGRDKDKINSLVKMAKSVGGVSLLDHSSDVNHNRSVFTLMGDIEGIEEVIFRLTKLASEIINLNVHKGEHPRMGATDVIPFVPIKDVTVEECVELSKRVGKRIADELNIPVFLYEDSCTRENCRNLADIRKGEFEGMKEKMLDEKWHPDFGPSEPHHSAGVVAVGARFPLVAFNVNLSTSDIKIAKAIAKSIRGSNNGYKYCKAIGVMLEDRNIAQVSMNLVNYELTPIYRVFEAIRFEAKRYGVTIVGSELIGLAPAQALLDASSYYLQLEGFDPKKQIIEYKLI